MRRRFLFAFLGISCCLLPATSLRAEGLLPSPTRSYYQAEGGKVVGAKIIRRYRVPVVHPDGRIDPRLDPRLRRAATIAQERAHARAKARCWRYVKEALFAAGAINSYPKTPYACQAGEELVRNYGFTRLPVRDPYAAPIGAVIVYGKGNHGAGHVELRTRDGFVSDYHSKYKCFYPLLAVYGKYSS